MNCIKCGSIERYKDGRCRNCMLERSKLYNLTPRGKALKMWSQIICRAENRNGKNPTYANIKILMTRKEFLAWAIPELEKWILTNSIELASVDRIDNDGHYEISNLQLLDRWENSLKTKRTKNMSAPEGFAWCRDCKNYLPLDEFHKDKHTWNSLAHLCKFHISLRNQKYREKRNELNRVSAL